ncbi:MAG: inorganic phosphate transporter [Pseudomonadota bacterium]|nr:inorganic phosphate transporter [Pseudomonadota bacterium]
MSLRLNNRDRAQGLSANLITAALVLLASKYGLPVSTTHVSVGSIRSSRQRAQVTDKNAPQPSDWSAPNHTTAGYRNADPVGKGDWPDGGCQVPSCPDQNCHVPSRPDPSSRVRGELRLPLPARSVILSTIAACWRARGRSRATLLIDHLCYLHLSLSLSSRARNPRLGDALLVESSR